MKKFFLASCLFTIITQFSFAQVKQKKANTNTSTVNPAIKKVEAQQNTNQSHNIPVKVIAKNPNLKTIARNPVFMSLYTKKITFADGTKMSIGILNPALQRKPAGNLSNPKPNSSQTSQNDQAHCTTTNITLTDQSSTFMNNNYGGQSHYIFPGAIYNINDLFNGNFKEIKAGRNPVVITTDNKNMSGNSYEIVPNPDEATIHNAITQLNQRFTILPASTGQKDFASRVYEASSSADAAIKIGADVSGYGGSFSAYYGNRTSANSEYLTIDCNKVLYSCSVVLPDSGYFAKNASGDFANMVVISSVTYGARVLANLQASFQSDALQAGFAAGYSGWGVSADANLDFFSNNESVQSTINAYYVGGPGSTRPSFDKSQLETEVRDNFFGHTNYQNAEPISYELSDLNGNVLGYYTATDAFNVPVCVFNDLNNAVLNVADLSNIYAPKISPNCSYAVIKTGNGSGDNKDPDTHWSFGLLDNNGNHIASFHDDSNNDPYSDGTTTGKLYLGKENTATFGNFFNGNGGRIHINIAPNGHDTWNIDQFTLFLNFTGPTTSQQLTWGHIGLSENKRDVDLTFHYDKNKNGFVADAYSDAY